ncbi:hypothetical protein J2S30_002308 [Herbaspirillum rubrisubalbicans]|jgi:hypothetical protein|uniref:hypothetical protein n=1 Tax=Herbaspirillum rubrisubalbicans TaxID=80842 RepID=UPI0015C54FEB|nr:hypothetical protein [Herbaspirillum rubrisubalbicans]MCP1573929.1 hypothetical protein [Herbaspirillum rubrisubalbicans]NQE48198.1 hypothetical protein [Herbaspirillum rubrisubalbicans]
MNQFEAKPRTSIFVAFFWRLFFVLFSEHRVFQFIDRVAVELHRRNPHRPVSFGVFLKEGDADSFFLNLSERRYFLLEDLQGGSVQDRFGHVLDTGNFRIVSFSSSQEEYDARRFNLFLKYTRNFFDNQIKEKKLRHSGAADRA